MGTTEFMRLIRIEGGVNPSEHHVRPAFACHFANCVTAQRICCMDTDAHNIPSADAPWIHRRERFIDQGGIAERGRRRRRQYI